CLVMAQSGQSESSAIGPLSGSKQTTRLLSMLCSGRALSFPPPALGECVLTLMICIFRSRKIGSRSTADAQPSFKNPFGPFRLLPIHSTATRDVYGALTHYHALMNLMLRCRESSFKKKKSPHNQRAIMKKPRAFGIIVGVALLATTPFSLHWSQENLALSVD